MFYLVALFLFIFTIRFLPFINIDASLRLQYWIKDTIKKIEDAIDTLERKKKGK